ncbi:DUF2330 domain-containing protein [Streptomyces sp. DT224]|uniref:DUF2330 domain-containing protein n=1 Tax=Streptomyces sp. DT224 TaxID=3393426 RepID=UPI003CF11A82
MLVSLQAGSLIAPAYACGCGAMVVDQNSRMVVDQETSAVAWDGRTEQIVMQLSVRGNSRTAAWIMPVPHRATVELGDAALFSELKSLTASVTERRHHFWPGDEDWPFGEPRHPIVYDAGPKASAPVDVVGRERLGPFDVARLASTDPEALGKWLKENGFELPDRLTTALTPYVEQKWEYVAVRLAPEERWATLNGTLDPLRLRFASDRLVYPMRLSRLAATPQSLSLYVLADHRMEPRDAIGGRPPKVAYAGRVDPAKEPYEALAAVTGDQPVFVTAIDQYFPSPERIDGDHELRATAEDTPYRTVVYRDALLTWGGMPAWLLTLVGGAVLVVALPLFLVVRARRRRPVPPPPPVFTPPPLR